MTTIRNALRMIEQKLKTVFLTGATSGIGRATAELLSRNGYEVWGTTRDLKKLSGVLPFRPLELRLESHASIESAWQEALRESGNIDIVIQNAGSGIFGAVEDVPMSEAHVQWQIAVEGPLRILQLAAAHLRPRQQGLIIGVSSLAAEMPMAFSTHYSAGKAAFSTLLAGLWMELKPFGVRVVDLRPGDIRTTFNDNLPKPMAHDSAYLPWLQRAWRETERLLQAAPPPERVACDILRIIRENKTRLVVRSGTFFQAKLAPWGSRFLTRDAMLDSIRGYYGLKDVDGK